MNGSVTPRKAAKVLLPATAAFLTALFADAQYRFGIAVAEPTESPARIGLGAVVVWALLHGGLAGAPFAGTAPTVRAILGVLMIPSSLLFLGIAADSLQRSLSGQPFESAAGLGYALGGAAYLAAWGLILLPRGLSSNREPHNNELQRTRPAQAMPPRR